MSSIVGERQFGRHFKRQFRKKIAARQCGVNFCREASRCLARPSGHPNRHGASKRLQGELGTPWGPGFEPDCTESGLKLPDLRAKRPSSDTFHIARYFQR